MPTTPITGLPAASSFTPAGTRLATAGANANRPMGGSVAESPQSPSVRYPEYTRLFAGGTFPITLGIGFDESGWHSQATKAVLNGLAQRGFQQVNFASLSDAELRGMKIDPALVDRQGDYFVKAFTYNGKQVQALLKLVTPSTPNAVERFRCGFEQRGLIIYGGHARYGSGPDFDSKDSPAGNLVISAAEDSHMREILKGKPNALREMKLTREYQLMVFAGCETRRYFDDLNTLAAGKDDSNLDMVGSTAPLLWSDISSYALKTLDVVLAGESADALNKGLEQISHASVFAFDGFIDNTPPTLPS